MSDRRRANKEARPTFNERAERSAIGSCLRDDRIFWDNFTRLKPEDFAVPRLGRIWAAMQRCGEARKPVNQNWVAMMIDPIDRREDTPIQFYLTALFNDAPPASEADIDFETVANFSHKRAAVASLQLSISEILATDVGVPAEHLKDIAIRNISTAFNGERDNEMMDYHEWGARVWHRSVESMNREEEGGFGLSPGLTAVEQVIGRLLPGKLYVLAGMSSSGKSALARQIVEAASMDGLRQHMGKAYIASLEMTGDEYATRHLAEALNIASWKIEQGDLQLSEVERMGAALDRMKRFPIIVDSRPRLTMSQIRARALKVKNTSGVSLMALDHLLLIKGEGKMDSMMDRVSDATIEAKNMAKEFDCPVIMLAQIDEKRLMESTTKWPNSTMLFGGQSIMQNADGVIFIHRPEVLMAKHEPAMEARAKDDEKKTPWQKWNDMIEPYRGKGFVYNNKRRGGAPSVRKELNFRAEVMTFSDI